VRAVSIPVRAASATPLRSRRILALAGDARLVEQVRGGNDAAFEVVFERHGAAILAFCRHMLGTPEEAEDAVQHTFAAAYRDLQRGGEREIVLKPWLFAIARNRCLSVLRARREVPAGVDALQSVGVDALESSTPSPAGLAEQVEARAELRRLLADVRELPDDQRAALLLTELGDLSQAEVADVLRCEVSRVKGLVFRARSALIARREARERPCETIREQLANLRGGALRRSELRLHLRECPGCRAYREQVRQQRRLLAAALPVAPTLGLKSSVLAAIGIGGGSAGGLTAAGSVGGATLAKVAVAGVLAGGGVVAGEAVVDSDRQAAAPPAPPAAEETVAPAAGRNASTAATEVGRRGGRGARTGADGAAGAGGGRPPVRPAVSRGRGPIQAPPGSTPVRRGPRAKPWRSGPGAKGAAPGQAKGHAKPAPGWRAGAKQSPTAKGRPNQPGANGGPGANRGPRPNRDVTGGVGGNGGARGNGGATGNGGPTATGSPNSTGTPRANARPPRRRSNGSRRLSGSPKPSGTTKAPARPKATADTAPSAGTEGLTP
jgi:RNA polymerase sigma factor (sigma-70 family)